MSAEVLADRADLIYKLLLAEIAGQRGRLDVAMENYLYVARRVRDPDIVARAVRIAVYARDDRAAMEAATLWAELSPESHEAMRIKVALFLRADRLDEAVRELNKLITSWKGKKERVYTLVVELIGRERNKEKAYKVMDRVMETRQKDPSAMLAYANFAVRSKNLELASKILPRCLALTPDDPKVAILYAQVLQDQGKTNEAIEQLKEQLEKKPDEQKLRTAYARLLVNGKRYDEALDEFRVLVKGEPDNSDVRFAMALLLLQTNRNEKAAEQFNVLIDKGARALTSQYYLGQIAEVSENTAEAITRYRKVDRGQHYMDAQIRVVVLLARQEGPDKAIQHLHGLKTRNDQEEVRLYLVETELLADAGRQADAMAAYARGLEEFPENTDLLYARAMLGEKMDRLDILERDLRSILALEPKNVQALNALGYTLADRTDRYEEAYQLIHQAISLKPQDYYILDSMGWVLYRLGRYQEALDHLRRAAEITKDAEVAAHLGEVLWVTGDQQAARDVWDSAIKIAPDAKQLLEVIERFSK
ncbi:MAG: tetratricopeptide repeat protein [Gammaproteobacteria bacterium]|nr:tetratricopeptide repeat protein [Gammaproteobacteria bacterium]